MKDFTKSYYNGIKGIYFSEILSTIVRLGALDRRDVRVLDYGCGVGRLSKILPGKVIGYDIIPSLSEIDDWRCARFDIVVANQVFYLLSAEDLNNFLVEVKMVNPNAEFIVGISRQELLNNIVKYLAGEPDAHTGTKLRPMEELKILTNTLDILDHETVFKMCEVYHMRFKTSLPAHIRTSRGPGPSTAPK